MANELASGKDGSFTMTGAGTGVTVTKFEYGDTPNMIEFMTFGSDAPKNEAIHDNWLVTFEGFLTDGGTPPAAGELITDLELELDGTSGHSCSAAVISSVTKTAEAGGHIAISGEIKPNGVAMAAYGTVA